ncbi:hypothetical protein MycrhDRAFT_5713 [Mycolicibacterium rhodesiae JS60]|nr:hypothetical protein MycrhDRAFT_5713 [Mycolicibacterium rhodesiae JS60]
MSRRHRHFSVLPARLANGGEGDVSPASPPHALFVPFASGSPELPSRRAEQVNFRLRRRRWIVEAGAVAPTVPMWTSRTGWVTEVAVWAASCEGASALGRVHVARKMFAKVTAALAQFADGTSGRHCAVTNRRVASAAACSPRTVTTIRKILAQAAFALEVRRGTGAADSPVHARRPSIWHLTSRRRPVETAEICDLPRSRRVTGSVLLGSNSPSPAPSAEPSRKSRTRSPARRPHRQPRPLHTQRLAAWLASTAVGLSARPGQHIVGQICDALTSSHLNLDAWTGTQLVQALNDDMRVNRLTWPDHIDRPGPFLATRLRRLPAEPAHARRATTSPPAEPEAVSPSSSGPASLARIEAQRLIRAILAPKR